MFERCEKLKENKFSLEKALLHQSYVTCRYSSLAGCWISTLNAAGEALGAGWNGTITLGFLASTGLTGDRVKVHVLIFRVKLFDKNSS